MCRSDSVVNDSPVDCQSRVAVCPQANDLCVVPLKKSEEVRCSRGETDLNGQSLSHGQAVTAPFTGEPWQMFAVQTRYVSRDILFYNAIYPDGCDMLPKGQREERKWPYENTRY